MTVNFLRRSWVTLLIFLALLPMRSPVYAGAFDGCKRILPHETTLRVSGDFDGDSKTDTAFAKRYGSTYRVEIKLSTKRGRIRLTVPVRNEVGLELIAYDVN